MNYDLKREVLILAGYMMAVETISNVDAQTSLKALVARICADQGANLTRASLIAVLLAEALDEAEPK